MIKIDGIFLFFMLIVQEIIYAQVVGKVVDSVTDHPLVGASVSLKNSNLGTSTDVEGMFYLEAKLRDTLMITYIGYMTRDYVIDRDTFLDISLVRGVYIDEVVVTGYSTQSRRNISSAISIVDMDEVNKIASNNIADQLQGRVAGVQILNSGEPGAFSFVRIRGFGTVNNNEPLYIIDGIPLLNETNLNFLNPQDVESVQVLKDASSASIYGARAANGVVLITTKLGKRGSNNLSLNVTTGFQKPGSLPDLLNPSEQLLLEQLLAEGAGQSFNSDLYHFDLATMRWSLPDYIVVGNGFKGGVNAGDPRADPALYNLRRERSADATKNYLIQKATAEGTDWLREIFVTAPVTNYQLSVSGGNAQASYYISGNYYDHHGILINNDYKSYKFRLNNMVHLSDNFRIGNHLNIAFQNRKGAIGNQSQTIVSMMTVKEIFPIHDIVGNYGGSYGLYLGFNPVAQRQHAMRDQSQNSSRISGDFFLEKDYFEHLTFKSSFGVDNYSGRSDFFIPYLPENANGIQTNRLTKSSFSNISWNFFNTLSYSGSFTPQVDFDVLAGIEAGAHHYFGSSAIIKNIEFGFDPQYRQLNNGDDLPSVSSYEGNFSRFSVFTSMNLSISDRYFFTGIIRRDGSSRFLKNRYGCFPGFSAGWRISREQFLHEMNWIDELKIRIGYGQTGNNEAGDYPGYSSYSQYGDNINLASYPIDGGYTSVNQGFQIQTIGNPNLKWERTSVLNMGIDLTILGDLEVNVDWYLRRTDDMIYGVQLPTTAGVVGTIQSNIGSMKNTGIDINLQYKGGRRKNGINYSMGLTIGHYKNRILNLDNNTNTFVSESYSQIGFLTRTERGSAISQFRGFIVDGLWQSQEQIVNELNTNSGEKPGRFHFRDLNHDGVINDKDETTIGSPHPDLIYGFNFLLNYQNFEFSLFFNGTLGNEIFNYSKWTTHSPTIQDTNHAREMLYGAGVTLPVLDKSDAYSYGRSTFYIEDGSYLRLKNIQISYTVNSNILKKFNLDSLRIYFQAQNCLTLTKYSGLDPEVFISNITSGSDLGRDYSLGVDYGRYPTTRTFLIGVNLDF